ncbi:hypothetical protein [Edaphobacter modestus]|uniref:Uncharacterized protein n=1 Tax=Edaphobacter modestus TaxID=388466 RepID=A0A4Q7YYL5_9BACT|nr:hypothetical protein [Edaphobacter modestus]RZU42229.1 hypothetical protein BDD14_3782 [Edaphobacter modestus]
MDPILTKAITPTTGDSNGTGAAQLPKDGVSQFDKIKAQLQDTTDSVASFAQNAVSTAAPTPPASAAFVQPSSAAVQPADGGLKPAMGTARSQSIQSLPPGPEKVQQTVAVGRYHLDRIQSTVKANSPNSTMDKVKGKLTSIEAQYNQLDGTLQKISPNASPQDWLRLQQMANSMNENISVLSKLVDSASSGVKTILQTQI